MNIHFLYRASRQGVFGKCEQYSRSSITDALFVYLDGDPEPETVDRVDMYFRNRPLVCLTDAWETLIREQYPDAAIYRRTVMKPACRFIIPEIPELPEGYRLADKDEAVFNSILFPTGSIIPDGPHSSGGFRSHSLLRRKNRGGCLFLSEHEK